MTSATLYSTDMFVLLVPGEAEVFLTADELLQKLITLLRQWPDQLPHDLQPFPTVEDRAKHLRDTTCELEIAPGITWQWYAVRLEK